MRRPASSASPTRRSSTTKTNKTLDIEVKASDPAGNFVKAGFTVTIEDVDETVTPPGGGGTNNAPTGVSLSGASVDELALNGTVVGKLSAIDPDAMQTFSYQLSDDAGGRFVLLGDTLYVLNGVALDFEQAGAHQVTLFRHRPGRALEDADPEHRRSRE